MREAVLAQLAAAHPRVEVTMATDDQEFLELVSRADAAIALMPDPVLIPLGTATTMGAAA